MKATQQASRQFVDFQQLNAQSNTAETLLNLLSQYAWKRSTNGFRAKEHGSYTIYKKSGTWLFHAHNGDYTGGNALQVAAEIHNLDLKTAEGLHEAARQVCQAAHLNFAHYCSDDAQTPSEAPPQYKKPKPVKTTQWLPNAGKDEADQSFKSYTIAKPYSEHYKTFAQFYETKTGVKPNELKKYNVFPLASITKWQGKEQTFTPGNLSRLYITEGGTNSKFKYHATKTKKQTFFFQNSGHYVFGLSNLPTEQRNRFTLFITEGEDDTNCINANLQNFGYCAITGGSAAATFGENWIEKLKQEFKSVVSFLDNDAAGHKNSLRNAKKYGLPFVEFNQFPELTACKDICDIYQKHGVEKLKTVCDFAKKFKNCVVSDNESLAPHLADVLKLDIGNYLADKTDYLKLLTGLYPKMLLQSKTGTGKTTFIIDLAKDKAFLNALGVERILFAVPRCAIGEQMELKKCQERGVNAVFVNGKTGYDDIEAAAHSDFSIWTFDQLPKAKRLLSTSLLVIDELHKLESDNSFRGDVCDNLFALLPSAKRVLAMSATPIFEMCIGDQLNEKHIGDERNLLNFKLLQVQSQHRQIKNLQPIYYDARKRQMDALMHHVEHVANVDEGKAVIFLNDVKKLETAADLIHARLGVGAATILSSKTPQYSEENDIYRRLKNGEALPDDLKFILCTSFADCGVDFDFPVSSVAFFGKTNTADLTQGMARPRHKGDVNANLNVYRYKSLEIGEKETVFADFEQTKIQKDTLKKWQETATETFENTLRDSLRKCDKLNDIKIEPNSEKKYLDETEDIFWSETAYKWQISYPSVFVRHRQHIFKQLTEYGAYWQIKRLDQTVQIAPPQYISPANHEEAMDLLNAKKSAATQNAATAFEIVANDKHTAFEIVGRTTRDKTLKEEIKTQIALPKETSEAAAELKKAYPSVKTADLQKPVKRLLKLEKLLPKFRELKQKDLPNLLVNLQRDHDFELFYNRLCTFDDLRNAIDGRSTYRAEQARKLSEAVQIAKNRKRGKAFKTFELVDLVSKTTGQKVDLQTAKMRVGELFDLSQTLDVNRKTVYQICDKLTLADVVKAVFEGKNQP
jgi:hypothetical protein